ncbi:MAG: spore coat associated protein CotJA [bacterium]|jgi:hypothetical protein
MPEEAKVQEAKAQEAMQHLQLARAYVPFQIYTTRFDPVEGLRRGTIFPELYMPYKGWKREEGNGA